jgi:aspartate aminotransferase-like enzyme
VTTAPFGTFFLPGPTEVRPEILAAMMKPMIPHRGREFESLFARIQAGLKSVFRTSRPIFVSTSSATGLMESAVRCAPAGPILAVVNGAFSERFAQLARACDREVDVLDVRWGEVPALDELEARLRARQYGGVTVVHSETSTGALTDVAAVGALARANGAACLVDSVTGVGGAPLFFDDWGLDFALTGSQKALALPPGLAFGVASEEHMRHARRAPARGLYFDPVEFEQYALKDQTPNTPALSLLYALDAQLERLRVEGMEARWERHAAMAARTEGWVRERADRRGDVVDVFAPEGSRSPTVSAIALPAGTRGGDVVAAVAAEGFTVGGGYGKLRDGTFRIGHMGDHTLATLDRCLAACDAALDALAPATRGG